MGSIILFITCVWIQNNPHLLEEFDENGNNIPEEEECLYLNLNLFSNYKCKIICAVL